MRAQLSGFVVGVTLTSFANYWFLRQDLQAATDHIEVWLSGNVLSMKSKLSGLQKDLVHSHDALDARVHKLESGNWYPCVVLSVVCNVLRMVCLTHVYRNIVISSLSSREFPRFDNSKDDPETELSPSSASLGEMSSCFWCPASSVPCAFL